MLQRYKKNRTSASFLLTKCATFFVRRYEGTFLVPSEALVVLYAYGSLIISVSIASGNGVVSGLQGYCKGITRVLQKSVINPSRAYTSIITSRKTSPTVGCGKTTCLNSPTV